MTEPLTEEELAKERQWHRPYPTVDYVSIPPRKYVGCAVCMDGDGAEEWPCFRARMIATIDAAREVVV